MLALPSATKLLAGSLIGHMPIGMVTLTLLLGIAHISGSYSFAGVVVGLYVTASGLVAPMVGRHMDRRGVWPVLAGTGAAFATAMIVLMVCLIAGAPHWCVVAAVVAAGASRPVLPGATQALWAGLATDTTLRKSAYALQSMQLAVAWIIGPLVVGAVLALLGPGTGALVCLGVSALLTTSGALIVGHVSRAASIGVPAAPPPAEAVVRDTATRPTLYTPSYLVVLFCTGLYESAMASTFVTIGVYAEQAGMAAGSGLLVALWFGGSLLGGSWFGGRSASYSLVRQYRWCLAVFALGSLLCALFTVPWQLAIALVICGMAIAPTASVQYITVATLAPQQARGEGFTWLQTLAGGGGFAGSALADPVIRHFHSTAAGFVLSAVTLGLAVILTGVIRADRLRSPFKEHE